MTAQPLVPPPSPYGAPPGGPPPVASPPQPGMAGGASLSSSAGQYTVRTGSEVRVGRDPAQCPIYLAEPRVSGVHATLRFEMGQLLVRDETSNNGTWIAGARIAPGVWTPVPPGAPFRIGPVEFAVRLEA
jgi:pSer/pThr/pTyr-binding forkhead associated (FHA) protein